MENPGHNPLHDRPEPEHDCDPENDNLLDKTSLDFKNEESVLGALQDRKIAAELLLIAAAYEEGPAGETSPLQAFGVVVGAQRRKIGYSLEEVASRAGIPPGDLLALELGELPFKGVLNVLPAVGKALDGKGTYLSRALAELVLDSG